MIFTVLMRINKRKDAAKMVLLAALTLFFLMIVNIIPTQASASSALPPTFSNYKKNKEIIERQEKGIPEGYEFNNEKYIKNGKNNAFEVVCPAQGFMIERALKCTQTLIQIVVVHLSLEFSVLMRGAMFAALVLATVLFGVKVLNGELRQPFAETALFIIKILMIMWVSLHLGGEIEGDDLADMKDGDVSIVGRTFHIMESLGAYSISAMTFGELDDDPFIKCDLVKDDSPAGDTIWQRLDCLLKNIIVGGAEMATSPLFPLMAALFWTNIFGMVICWMIFWTIVVTFLLIIRCAYVFLASYLFLSVLLILAPLFVPMILFEATKNMFQSWLTLVFSMLLQPAILLAFMVFYFSVLHNVFNCQPVGSDLCRYSMSNVIGTNWMEDQSEEPLSDGVVEKKMKFYKEETGYDENDPQYVRYKESISNQRDVSQVGKVRIENDSQLFDIKVNKAQDLINRYNLNDIPGLQAVGGAVDALINKAIDMIEETLIPFKVPRIDMENQKEWLHELMIAVLCMVILVKILKKFAEGIPNFVSQLSGTHIAVGGRVPLEAQLYGLKEGIKGAISGGLKGAAQGGKKGAIKGVVRGGAKGYAKGAEQKGGGKGLDAKAAGAIGNTMDKIGKAGGKGAGGGK